MERHRIRTVAATLVLAAAPLVVLQTLAASAPDPAHPPGASPSKPAGAPASTIVLCAPGYPGNTVQAQPTMDAFARAVEKAAGWPSGRLAAVYEETQGGGIARLRKPETVLAITTLPFFIQEAEGLGLRVRMGVQRNGSATQQWSLVAKKDRVKGAKDLEGWEIAGPAGYAPGFVLALLSTWGTVPSSAKVSFAPAPLGALRRVVDGEDLAVLLEPEQVQALFPKHPFAQDIEIVAKSAAVPGSVVCTVGQRLSEADAKTLLAALTRLQGSPQGAEALKSLRVDKFVTAPDKELASLLQRAGSTLSTAGH